MARDENDYDYLFKSELEARCGNTPPRWQVGQFRHSQKRRLSPFRAGNLRYPI